MEHVMNDEMRQKGQVLLVLKEAFLRKKCDETLMPLLLCLRDVLVWVPMIMNVSEKDQERMANAKPGEEWTCEDEVKMKPDVVRSKDGRLWFPIYSQKEQIPSDSREEFSLLELPVLQCLEIAHKFEKMDGLVLDPFTASPLALPFALADTIKKIPSKKEK